MKGEGEGGELNGPEAYLMHKVYNEQLDGLYLFTMVQQRSREQRRTAPELGNVGVLNTKLRYF